MCVVFQSYLVWNGQRGPIESDQVAALEDAQRPCNCFARRTNELADFFMRERKPKLGSALCGLSALAPLEQQAGQLFRR